MNLDSEIMAQLKSFRFIEPDSQLPEPRTRPESAYGLIYGKKIMQNLSKSTESLNANDEYQEIRVDFAASKQASEDNVSQSKLNRKNLASLARPSISDSIFSQNAGGQTPKLPGRTMKGESVSQTVNSSYSLRMTSDNCFEIQWRYLHLYSRKSKLPKIVTDNFVYKMFGPKPKISNNLNKSQDDLNLSVMGIKGSDPLEEFSSTDEYRPILSNVSGSVYSGQLTAILGPSGVGKSTLLNTLTGRNQLHGVGRVKLIGCAEKRVSVVFVPQIDVLPGRLTTIEDLQFTSQLKNPKFSREMHDKNIQRIVKLLHLEKFLNTRINKLSGGQERRLSIARELLSSPNIMILDEPTSGLDANTCKKIIQALRDLVEHSETYLGFPMSIIVTIHQPQREVYNLFHRINVMALGGRVIYEGSPGDLMPTFLENSALAKIRPPEQLNENPSIVALEVASGEYGNTVINDLAAYHRCQCEDFVVSPAQSPFGTPNAFMRSPKLKQSKMIQNGPMLSPNIGYKTPKTLGNLAPPQWDKLSNITNVSYASSYDSDLPEPIEPKVNVDKRLRRSVVMKGDFMRQTWVLMKRAWLLNTRDLFLMCIRIIGFVGVGLGLISIFSGPLDQNDNFCPTYQTDVDDVSSLLMETQTRLGSLSNSISQAISTTQFLFHMVFFILMVSAALGGLMFPIQLRMFLREYKNGWYSPASFITSTTLSELPVDFVGPAITVMVAYTFCNQPESDYHWREAGYIMLIIFASIICKSQAHIAGAFLMDSIENSVFISCVLVVVPVLISDIVIRLEKLPYWLQLSSYGSYLKWCFDGLFLLRYGYGMCPCDPEVIHGYPMRLSDSAIPASMDATIRYYSDVYNITTTQTEGSGSGSSDDENMLVQMIRLTLKSANAPLTDLKDLGDCSTYRSLILIQKHVADYSLPICLLALLIMFIFMRVVVYFCVRAVIKLRG